MHPTESLQLALQELKRADHSIAVSLKYTRTVDVIKSIIDRLINTLGFCLDAIIAQAKLQKKTNETPELARLKVDHLKILFPEDRTIRDFCDFFLLLRQITKARFERAQEYRRHVTMTAHLDNGQTIEITIDIISEYFERTKEFFSFVSRMIQGTE